MEIGPPPGVDRLRVVAHDHDVAAACGQDVDEIGLEMIRILVLVHEHELKLALITLRELSIVSQHAERFLEQVVEVQDIGRLLLFFIPALRLGDAVGEFEKVRVLLGEHLIDFPPRVQRKRKNIGQDFALRKELVLGVHAELRDHGVEQVLLIFAIHDREARRKARGLRVAAEHAVAHGVKCSAPKSGEIVRHEARDAIEHLARRFVREGEE